MSRLLCFYSAHWALQAQILALGGTMYSQKLSSLGLAVLASFVLAAPSVSSGPHQRPDQQRAGTCTETWVADGGAPVPPVPTKPPANYTIADGGAPVPPVPPPPRLSSTVTPQANLTADGGAPVPPVPPKQPQPSIADGGAPVPPLPPGPKGQLASFVV